MFMKQSLCDKMQGSYQVQKITSRICTYVCGLFPKTVGWGWRIHIYPMSDSNTLSIWYTQLWSFQCVQCVQSILLLLCVYISDREDMHCFPICSIAISLAVCMQLSLFVPWLWVEHILTVHAQLSFLK